MDFTGLGVWGTRYSLGRELTLEELELQLRQKERLDLEPIHQLAATRINSTFLESVDRYYAWRGVLVTTIGGLGIFAAVMLIFGVWQVAGLWDS